MYNCKKFLCGDVVKHIAKTYNSHLIEITQNINGTHSVTECTIQKNICDVTIDKKYEWVMNHDLYPIINHDNFFE